MGRATKNIHKRQFACVWQKASIMSANKQDTILVRSTSYFATFCALFIMIRIAHRLPIVITFFLDYVWAPFWNYICIEDFPIFFYALQLHYLLFLEACDFPLYNIGMWTIVTNLNCHGNASFIHLLL